MGFCGSFSVQFGRNNNNRLEAPEWFLLQWLLDCCAVINYFFVFFVWGFWCSNSWYFITFQPLDHGEPTLYRMSFTELFELSCSEFSCWSCQFFDLDRVPCVWSWCFSPKKNFFKSFHCFVLLLPLRAFVLIIGCLLFIARTHCLILMVEQVGELLKWKDCLFWREALDPFILYK